MALTGQRFTVRFWVLCAAIGLPLLVAGLLLASFRAQRLLLQDGPLGRQEQQVEPAPQAVGVQVHEAFGGGADQQRDERVGGGRGAQRVVPLGGRLERPDFQRAAGERHLRRRGGGERNAK